MTASERESSAWRRLWGSVSFRLTLNYSVLATFTTVLLLVFAYGKIVDVLQTQFSRQVALTTHRLVVHFEDRGRDALQAEITQLLSDQTDIDTEMYLLVDDKGEKIAGNLGLFAAGDFIRDPPSPIQLDVLRDGAPAAGFLAIRRLTDGSTLVVGRDTQDMAEIRQLIGRAVVAATLVALLLVMIGTFIFRRELRRRVEAIRATAFHVGTGELNRRIPAPDQLDEFEHLRYDINHMLDRIETLMKGVRNVSDSIAHNVRTPLARVLAQLHKAQNGRNDAQVLAAAIASASKEIMDLIVVSEKLLQIAEAESGVRRQTFQPVALERIVRDVIDLYEPLADESGIVLEHRKARSTEHIEGETEVLGDADLLAGVVANLVDNGMKYAGHGAHITITTGRRGNSASLTVKDDGPGVAARHLPLLGTRFYRVVPDSPGSGLGLASVQAVVGLHEGALRFLDTTAGFTVDIELPLASSR